MDMNEQSERPKAYSYVRFSTPEQQRGDSFRRQTEAAEAYAREHGLDLDLTHDLYDLGVSAFRGANIKGGALGKFRRLVEDGDVAEGSYLLVENLDRVSRASAWTALGVLQGLVDSGIAVVTLQDRKVYSNAIMKQEPYQILESIITMIRANEESETKSKRVRAAWAHKKSLAATEKKPLTRRLPAWMSMSEDRKTIELISDKAEIVLGIFKDADNGVGQHLIAHQLNQQGVEPFGDGARKATFWHRSYIAKILSNPAVIGVFVPHEIREVNGKRVRRALDPIPGYFPPVVSKAMFDRVNVRLDAGTTPRVRAAKGQVSNIIAGLAKCPSCESTMTRVNKGAKNGTPYLVCTKAKAGAGCQYRQVKLTLIEAAVEHYCLPGRLDPPSGDEGLDAEFKDNQDAWADVTDAIEHILIAIEQGTSSEALTRRLSKLEHDLLEIEAERDALSLRMSSSHKRVIKKRIDNLTGAFLDRTTSITQRNLALRDVFSSIVVDHSTGGMRCYWKQGGAPAYMAYTIPDD